MPVPSSADEIVISVVVISGGDMIHYSSVLTSSHSAAAADNHRTPTLSFTGFNSRLATKLLVNIGQGFLLIFKLSNFLIRKEKRRQTFHPTKCLAIIVDKIMIFYLRYTSSPVPFRR